MESILNGYNHLDIGDIFCEWKYKAHWTPYGILFDIGGTTAKAIMNINLRKDYSGLSEENHYGLYYGYDNLPKKWKNLIVKKEEIFHLLDEFSFKYN